MSRPVVGFRAVLGRQAFRRLTVAHGLATLSQLVLTLAVGAHVAAHGSAVWASVAVALGFAPYALFSPLAGVLADRSSRSAVLAWSAAVRAVLSAEVALALLLDLPAPVVVGLAALAAVAATPSYPALAAATPETVPDRDLETANALVTCVENGSWMAGPGLFGLLLLVGLDPSGVAVFSVVPLVAAAALAFPVRLPRPGRAGHGGWLAELGTGVAQVARRPDVRRPMLLAMLDNFVYGYLVAVLVLMTVGGRGTSGTLQAVLTGGAVVAALGVGALTRRWTTRRVLTTGLLLSGAAVTALGVLGTDAPLAALVPWVALAGASGMVAEVAAVSMLQRSPDPAAVARVFGVYDQLNVGAIAVGSALAGVLGHAVGAQAALLIVGAVVVLLVVPALGWRPWPTTPPISSSSPPSTSRAAVPSSSSKVLPAQRRPSETPSRQR
jgi:MFS family permease